MDRRDFVKNISLISAPVFMLRLNIEFMLNSFLSENIQYKDRILILIKLNGGNDGLNTFIPLDSYDNLHKHRSKLIIPENAIIKVGDKNGFHPSLTGFNELFTNEKLGIIQNTGYKNQNRSHFRSMDIWSRGMMQPEITSGWLGRLFESDHPEFPDKYPDENYPHPFAVSLGNEVSATCQGVHGNFSYTVHDPKKSGIIQINKNKKESSFYGKNITFIENTLKQLNQYDQEINKAFQGGNSDLNYYDSKNQFSVYLSNVVKMITGGLKTQIYVLNINGFDTHGGQLDQIDTTKGIHADLLKKLSDGITSFQKDIEKQGIDHRVIGLTFSEFGRQIATNENNGTDHGDAGPMFLFGKNIVSGIFGDNPVIEDKLEDQAGVPFKVDFRDIYASVLKDWWGIPEKKIEKLFDHPISYHSVIKS